MSGTVRYRIEYRDGTGARGVGHIEVEGGLLSQLIAEVQFIKAAEAEGRKLWSTWSCREPLAAAPVGDETSTTGEKPCT